MDDLEAAVGFIMSNDGKTYESFKDGSKQEFGTNSEYIDFS
jgi:hypothetical protein